MDINRHGYGTQSAYVRVFHASPDAPPVDVYLNNDLIASNFAYQSFTPYLQRCPGRYRVRVFPAGTMEQPVIDQVVDVTPQNIITLAVIGRLVNISLLPIGPSAAPRIYGKAFVRFVHLSPNAPRVDVAVEGGPTLFSDVGYMEITNYQAVDPNTYILVVKPAGTNLVALRVPDLTLDANFYYTVYAVGLVGEQPPLEAILALDMKA